MTTKMTSELRTALQAADIRDGYLKSCRANPANRAAREKLSYIPWEDQSLADLCTLILSREPSEPRVPRIIIMHPTADGGMPHTRPGNIICIPANFPHDRLVKTLKHEKIHLQQRLFPEAWKRNLQVDGWSEYPVSMLPQHLTSQCRINPDTIASPFWCWKKRWVPMPLFQRPDAPSLREVSIRWWDIENNSLQNSVPQSLLERYGTLPAAAYEHPYEIYAYIGELNNTYQTY